LIPRLHRELFAARELLELRLLVVALDALLLALRLEHPSLHDLDEPTSAPTLRAARLLVARARPLRAALHAYRAAVRRSLASPLLCSLDADIPF
jgi:hypothetical protein